MNNSKIAVHIECGEKGIGKTTFVKQKWKQHLFLACGDPLNKIKTTGALFFALEKIYGTVMDNLEDIVEHLRKALQDGFVLIVDEAEHIDEGLLETIVNSAILYKNSTIVFTFDLDSKLLYQSKIFRQLIKWDIVRPSDPMANFCAATEMFNVFIENAMPGVFDSCKGELIEASNQNFNNLKGLLWLVLNKQTDFERINEDVIAEYSLFLIEEKLSSLPKDLLAILKKSSIIGEMFQSCILESPDGFHVLGVKAYLKKLEATSLFIQSYLQDDVYQFITSKIYTGVLKSIEPHEKVESQQILLHYYMTKIASEREGDKMLEQLRQLKRLSNDLKHHEVMFFTDKKLLFHYLKIGDIAKAREVLIDLLAFCKETSGDAMLYLFLCYYKIRLDMSTNSFKDALTVIRTIQCDYPNNSNLYLQYYYARSLYGIGDVDASSIEASKLGAMLKETSMKAANNQPIYALTYSLLATIQYHFGTEDFGNRYYTLALNHSKHKLKDKSTYFEILKKCDMYYEFEHSYPLMLQSISYFESVGRVYDAAEIYVNLATEMIFNDVSDASQAERFFEKASKIFANTPNENLAYTQNNWAILRLIKDGDFQSALVLLENSLLVGMSNFTYMTIYLNICMCHLAIYGYDNSEFNQVYDRFSSYYSKIKTRDNATQYEDVYKGLLDILIMERKGQRQEVVALTDKLLSNAPSQFFLPILEDVKARNTHNSEARKAYPNNKMLYEALNKYDVFLAEFRFWE